MAICPGATQTNLLAGMPGKNLGPPYEHQRVNEVHTPEQRSVTENQCLSVSLLQTLFSAEQCAQGAVQVIELASTGSVWIVEGGENPYEYVMPDRFKFTEKHYVTN